MAKKKSKNSFEEDLSRLEEISSFLENNNIGLDEAISLFEEGIKLSQSCLKKLKDAELKITELRKELDQISSDDEEE